MRSLILGGYSCLSVGEDASCFAHLCDTVLAPLLQYLYKNAHFEFTLYVSTALTEWISVNRPAVCKLISRLIRRKTLSLLIAPKNHCFIPISTAQDVLDQVEQMRILSRKHYKSKCKGFFAFGGFWSPELIGKLVKSDVSYAVIPSFAKDRIAQEPFFMVEHAKRFVIYPSDCFLEEKAGEYLSGLSSFEKLKADIERYATRSDKDRSVSFFLDFDAFLRSGKDAFSVIDSIFCAFRGNGFRSFTTDDDISFKRIGYLSAGSYRYGESFLEGIFKRDETFDRIALASYASSLASDKLIAKKDRERIKSISAVLQHGGQFVPGYNSPKTLASISSEFFSAFNSGGMQIPEILTMDFMGLLAVKKKGYLAFVDTALGCIRRIIGLKNGQDTCFSAPSFRDIVQDSRKVRVLVKYGSYSLRGVFDGRVELDYQNDSLEYAIRKSFFFLEGSVSCSITLSNVSDRAISFSFAQLFSFIRPISGLDEGEDVMLPLSSAKATGLLGIDDLSKSQRNESVASLDPGKTYIPYYDISLPAKESCNFTYSLGVLRMSVKGRKAGERRAQES